MVLVKAGKFLCLTVFTFLLTFMVASPTFAASSGTSWHDGLGPNQSKQVGLAFRVDAGSTITLGVDQYVMESNGNWGKNADVTYTIHNVSTQRDLESFRVDHSVGGAAGAPAYSRPYTNVRAGTYVIIARNNTSSNVATGGNVYVSN